MADLRDLLRVNTAPPPGAPLTAAVPQPGGLRVNMAPNITALTDRDDAENMGQLRRGYESGRLGGDANLLTAQHMSLRAAGKQAEADELAKHIEVTNQRAATFAPAEQDVTKLGWNPGRILDYGLGAVGQAGASMADPIAMSMAGNAAGGLVGMIPHPVAQAASVGLRGAGILGGYYNMARQAKGEFGQEAYKDPELMARTTPQDLNEKGNILGAVSGAIDTALPGYIGGRMVGAKGIHALERLSMPKKLLMDTALEAGQETSQEAMKKGTLGLLNPNRDTSGDVNDYWNAAAGGAFGGGGIGGASHGVQHVISSAVNRVGTKDDTSSDDVSGKAKADAPPKDLTESLVRRAKGDKSAEAERWLNVLHGTPAEDADDAARESAMDTQHAALVAELTARVAKGDTAAQQHLDAVSTQDMNDPVSRYDEGPRTAAAAHITGDGTDHERLIDRYSRRADNTRKFNTQTGPMLKVGSEDVAVGQPVAAGDLGAGKTGGVKVERDSPQMKALIEERRAVKQRADLTARVMSDAVAPGAKPQLKSIAADLGREIAEFAGGGYKKPTQGDVARVVRMGAQLVHLYGRDAHDVVAKIAEPAGVAGTSLYKILNASVSAARDIPAYKRQQAVARDEAAKQLVAVIPPKAQLTLHRAGLDLTTPEGRSSLLDHVEEFFDGESSRPATAFNATFTKDAVEQMRLIVGQRLEPRVEAFTEVSSKAKDGAEDTSPYESDETGTGEELDAMEEKDAEKKLENAPGHRHYFFHGGRNVGADQASHPFGVSKKTSTLPGLASTEAALEHMEAAAYKNLGIDSFVTRKTARGSTVVHSFTPAVGAGATVDGPMGKRTVKGLKPEGKASERTTPYKTTTHTTQSDAVLPSMRVHPVTAKSVMDHHHMPSEQRVDLMFKYLVKEAALDTDNNLHERIKDLDARIALARQPADIGPTRSKAWHAAQLVKHANLKKERQGIIASIAQDLDLGDDALTMSLEKLADRYFENRHLILAEQIGDKDQMRMMPAEVTQMLRRGNADIEASKRKGKGNPTEVQAEMNLLRFKSPRSLKQKKDADGNGEAVVRVADLVKWVFKNNTNFDKAEGADDGTSAAAGRAVRYRASLFEGIAAMVADGYMVDMPYMINAKGEHEPFAPGKPLPASLRLSGVMQGKLDAEHAEAVASKVETDQALQEQENDRSPEERAKAAERAERAHQMRVARDQDKGETQDRNTNRDELRVPSEAEKEQTEGVPTDRTDLRNRNSVMDAALDQPVRVTVGNAMRTGERMAREILGAMSQGMHMVDGKLVPHPWAVPGDLQSGLKRLRSLVNDLQAGQQYAAPLAYALTPKNVSWLVSLAQDKHRATVLLEGFRSKTAAALSKSVEGGLNPTQRRELAALLSGTEKLPAPGIKKAMDRIVAEEKAQADAEAAAREVTLTGTSPYLEKDQAKADKANKFIGRGSENSSTAQYAKDFGNRANTGSYEAGDVVFVSAEGNRTGRVNPDRAELDKAVAAGVTFITDNEAARKRLYNVGERQVAKYLTENGYIETKSGEWTKPAPMAAKTEAEISAPIAPVKEAEPTNAERVKAMAKGEPLMRPWRPEDGEGEGTELPSRSDGVRNLVRNVAGMATAGRKLNTQTTPAGVQSSEGANVSDEAIEAAKAEVAKTLGPKVKTAFLKVFDAAGVWVKAENLIKFALGTGPGLLTVAHHETIHAFFDALVEHHPKAAEALKNVLGGKEIHERLKGLLANEPAALEQMENDASERVAYAYQFWRAGLLDVDKPATTMFAKLRKFLRVVLGMVRESETALDIITAFSEGKAAGLDSAESPAGRVIKGILSKATWNEDVKRKFDKAFQGLHSLTAPANDVLRKEVMSATAQALGLTMFTNPGEEGAGQFKEGYLNARARVGRQFSNRLYQVLKNLSERDMVAAIEMLQRGQKPEESTYPPVANAVKGIYGLLQRYRAHAAESGLKLENLGDNYFPRIWDLAKLIEGDGKDKFTSMLMGAKYEKKINSMLATINADRKKLVTKEEFVAAMYRQIVDKGGVDEDGMDAEVGHDELIMKPFFASEKERNFKWIDAADVAPFLEKDLVGAMSRYLHQGVRAAEFARRFGDGGGKLKALLKMKGDMIPSPNGGLVEAEEHGPIAQEIMDHLKEKGIEGAHAEKILNRHMEDIVNAVAAHEGSIGGDISPTFRKLSSAAMAYQNMRLLPMALFSAFADTAAIAARGPGLKGAYEALVKGLSDVYARWKDAASDMPTKRENSLWDDIAEAVGAVDSHMMLEQLGKAHTSEFMTDFARNANRKLFMLNGLTAWDRSMRVTATKFAVQFIQAHKSLPDSQHSGRWLAELGLTPEDIHLDAEGKLIWRRKDLVAQGMSNEDAIAAMEKTHYAITRWVEGAVLSPNAAQRPSWGSDPRWAVLFHLKQFTYSMHHTVLKRAFNEASQGNMNPIGALAAGIPIMMASDVVKGMVQGGGSLPAWQHGLDLGDRMTMAAQRAGLAGVGQFGIDALHDPAGVFGPTGGQMVKFAWNPSEFGGNLVDAVPGLRYIKPAKDLVMGNE